MVCIAGFGKVVAIICCCVSVTSPMSRVRVMWSDYQTGFSEWDHRMVRIRMSIIEVLRRNSR